VRLLTLGGTGFLSGAVVDAALARGHDVVVVHRGLRGSPPPGVRSVVADRDDAAGLARALGPLLVGPGAPDAVIDTCGYTVAGAAAAARVLGDVPRYVQVSSISAYRHWPPGPVRSEDDETFGPQDAPAAYGPMKAQSELVLGAALGARLLAVRAGLIVGPGDRTRRLTGWLHRIATRPRVAVPAGLDQPIAVVDVRDLAGWLVEAAGRPWSGAVTATGPAGMATFGGLLEACRAAVLAAGGTAATLVPLADDVLLAGGVQPWSDLPFWLPADVARTAWDVDTRRARELGLPTRAVELSVADAWAWVLASGLDHPDVPAHVEALAR